MYTLGEFILVWEDTVIKQMVYTLKVAKGSVNSNILFQEYSAAGIKKNSKLKSKFYCPVHE